MINVLSLLRNVTLSHCYHFIYWDMDILLTLHICKISFYCSTINLMENFVPIGTYLFEWQDNVKLKDSLPMISDFWQFLNAYVHCIYYPWKPFKWDDAYYKLSLRIGDMENDCLGTGTYQQTISSLAIHTHSRSPLRKSIVLWSICWRYVLSISSHLKIPLFALHSFVKFVLSHFNNILLTRFTVL